SRGRRHECDVRLGSMALLRHQIANFFVRDAAPTEISSLSLHDALPIWPVSSWKALNLRKTLLMASSVRLKPLNCSRLPCVYAQETLTFLLTQKKTCVKNYVQKE